MCHHVSARVVIDLELWPCSGCGWYRLSLSSDGERPLEFGSGDLAAMAGDGQVLADVRLALAHLESGGTASPF